jgi:hypothetical protein
LKRLTGIILAVVVIAAGTWYLLRPQRQAFGKAGERNIPVSRIADLTAQHVGEQVAIAGIIDRECPHAGCWAIIKDGTGELRIDTKKGGFTLPLRHEGSHVRIVGKLEKTASGDLQISATSAELG